MRFDRAIQHLIAIGVCGLTAGLFVAVWPFGHAPAPVSVELASSMPSDIALPRSEPAVVEPPLLEVSIREDDVHRRAAGDAVLDIVRAPHRRPSARAASAVASVVGPRVGTPALFENAWCDDGPAVSEASGVCWVLADRQYVEVDGRRLALVTMAGVGVDREGTTERCHACTAYLSFFVLSPVGARGWRIEAERVGLPSGSSGEPGHVRVAALGPSRVGWTVETFETHQDEWFWDLDVFAFEGRRITRVANTATGRQVPDSDDVSDLDSGITATTTLLRFDPSAVDGGFYRMTGERVVRRSDARPERVVRRRPVSVAYRTDRRAYPAVSLR